MKHAENILLQITKQTTKVRTSTPRSTGTKHETAGKPEESKGETDAGDGATRRRTSHRSEGPDAGGGGRVDPEPCRTPEAGGGREGWGFSTQGSNAGTKTLAAPVSTPPVLSPLSATVCANHSVLVGQ